MAEVFVAVIHRIHDPEGFRAAEAEALAAGLPDGVSWSLNAESRDHRLGICVWEGESVTGVRDVVEGVLGRFADNEYYEIEVHGGLHPTAETAQTRGDTPCT